MNTVLICSPSSSLHGGVENIIKDLCNELPARGWKATLALGRGTHFNNVDAYRKEYPDLPIVEIDGTGGTQSFAFGVPDQRDHHGAARHRAERQDLRRL